MVDERAPHGHRDSGEHPPGTFGDHHSTSLINQPRGAQIIQTNQLSTPVLFVMLAAMVLSIAIAAVAIGIANQAEREAQNAEREARVAMNHADLLDVDTKKNDAVIQTIITKQAVKEAIQEK